MMKSDLKSYEVDRETAGFSCTARSSDVLECGASNSDNCWTAENDGKPRSGLQISTDCDTWVCHHLTTK